MDLFTQIKMAVSVKEAAEYYGLEVKPWQHGLLPLPRRPHAQHEAERGLLLLLRVRGPLAM